MRAEIIGNSLRQALQRHVREVDISAGLRAPSMGAAASANLDQPADGFAPRADDDDVAPGGTEASTPRASSASGARRTLRFVGWALLLLVAHLFLFRSLRENARHWQWHQTWLLLGWVLAVFGVMTAVAERRRWRGPVGRLGETLAKVREGELPIESLNELDGTAVRALVPTLRELMTELRQQRADIAALHEEIRQRVAQRTDALERVIGSLRQQATRDALTGLFNRRFLDQYLPQLHQRCAASGWDLAVLMLDIDHFKPLNDTLGHAAGDEMLRAVGQIIRSGIRGEDAAFRTGGDEFVILMPRCGQGEAGALAERLAATVDGLAAPLKTNPLPRLSIGIQTLKGTSNPTPEGLLREADAHLYRCKRARR